MKIAIIGDSFSSDSESGSWTSLLSQNHQIVNFSQRGISQYKIFEIITQNLNKLQSVDKIIIWYTNSDRVYVNENVDYPTRCKSTHRFADMVASDALTNPDWNKIAKNYYKFFYNQNLQDFISECIINQVRNLLGDNIIECSGFDTDDKKIKSFFELRKQCQGSINHFNNEGNKIIYEWIKSNL